MPTKSFPQVTKTRLDSLSAYLRQEVMAEDFICNSYRECKASADCAGLTFYEGQLHHIGSNYDLEVDGSATRIVIVGQEYGHKPARVDLKARHEMILRSASATWRGRNPHMKGTTTLLRLLHKRDPGEDEIGEQLLLDTGKTIHLFDGFALVNYLLCSAVSGNSAQGKATDSMIINCARHLRKVIDILEPTLVILQGYGVRWWIAQAYRCPWKKGTVDEWLDLDGRLTRVLTFYHPSYRGCPWGRRLQSEYLDMTIIPAVARTQVI
jgi:hypothetical protein